MVGVGSELGSPQRVVAAAAALIARRHFRAARLQLVSLRGGAALGSAAEIVVGASYPPVGTDPRALEDAIAAIPSQLPSWLAPLVGAEVRGAFARSDLVDVTVERVVARLCAAEIVAAVADHAEPFELVLTLPTGERRHDAARRVGDPAVLGSGEL